MPGAAPPNMYGRNPLEDADGATTAHLVAELSRANKVRRVLWWHLTDRWYFGDFLRHAPWLPWLRAAFPGAVVDAATHPDYLPLLTGGGDGGLLDARSVDPALLASYDFVVVPGAFETSLRPVERGTTLSTWDSGWALRVEGSLRMSGVKDEINYFRAARPAAITNDPGRDPELTITPGADELADVVRALDRMFPGGQPAVVYNPTSSNPFTRETDVPKEVDNTLSAAEHAVVLRRLVLSLPDHVFVVGAARKQDDEVNAAVAREVVDRCAGPRVGLLADLSLPAVESLHGFAAVLGSPRVCSVAGGGTGTNTHLAALTGTFGFSVEHGSDAAMIRNWERPQDFQMGSFRWRNPSPLAGSHALDWSRRTPQALAAAADAFGCHHAMAHGAWEELFTDPPAARGLADALAAMWPAQQPMALSMAGRLLDVMTPAARAHYGDFTDETAFLHLKHGIGGAQDSLAALLTALTAPSSAALAADLFEHSNLQKLLHLLNTTDRCPGKQFEPPSQARGAREGAR
jgi:hypothetical protein